MISVSFRQLKHENEETYYIESLISFIIALVFLGFVGLWTFMNFNFRDNFEVGQQIDEFNGVYVYYTMGVLETCLREIQQKTAIT